LQGKHFRTYHLYSSISRGNWICRQLPISQCHYFTYMIYCLYACFFYVVYTNISQESLTKMYNMYTIARHPACESRLLKCILCNQCLSPLKWCSNPAHGEVYSIHYYVIKFNSDLRQVGGFLRVLRFPPSIKLTPATI
jgi:hypothetical protein